jgi:hypothetical protein
MNKGYGLTGALAAAVFAAQAAASLLVPPSTGDNAYRGTTGDVVNELLFATGMVLLSGALLLAPLEGRVRIAAQGAAVGCALLAVATIATVVAGEERWDAAFVTGFLLVLAGTLTAVVLTRSPAPALLLLGVVLSLAFYDRAGSLALAVPLVLWVRQARAPQPA